MSRLKETDKGNEDRRIRQTNNSYDDPERPDLLTLTHVFSKLVHVWKCFAPTLLRRSGATAASRAAEAEVAGAH